jgi:murein DD-endopeptidase MepM/ murein hydrolase activator NlpD
MAQLPRHRTTHLIPALACVLLLSIASPAAAVDLIGTWHVLVHYRDANAANPDLDRWEDKIWVFEPSGSRIRWTEYPIVVFADETGRFERRDTGQYARVMHSWEPNAKQRAEIEAGLAYNSRGSKAKTLRGSNAKGWKSRGAMAAASASVITYSEEWSIEGMPARPVFLRTDILGSARAENVEGGTLYETSEVSADGNEIRGRYDRDGSRLGTFRMLRAGAVAKVKDRTQEERQKEALGIQAQGAFGAGPETIEPTERAAPAVHDDDVRYVWPFDVSNPRRLLAGPGGGVSMTRLGAGSGGGHMGTQRWGFDFELPKGEEVLAARDGEVMGVAENFTERERSLGAARPTTAVQVRHSDGTWALYGHLQPEVSVKVGQKIQTGDRLGLARGQHLHFSVHRTGETGRVESVEIRFDDGSSEGVVPVSGASYGGQGGVGD